MDDEIYDKAFEVENEQDGRYNSVFYPRRPPRSYKKLKKRLDRIRVSAFFEEQGDEFEELRPFLWKMYLGLQYPGEKQINHLMLANRYMTLVQNSASSMHDKIQNDSFRTLTTDKNFQQKVPEDAIIRLLNAYVWNQDDEHRHDSSVRKGYYVQGMNVLCAPFLYAMPSQLEAFATFTMFVNYHAPRYVLPNLDGAHEGAYLVDICLAKLDRPLANHLQRYKLKAEIYAFHSVLTFSASTPPLHEVLRLWDFLFAWGPGLNILAVVARLFSQRDKLLSLHSSELLQRELQASPLLKTEKLLTLIITFVSDLSSELYDAIIRHPWDDTLDVYALSTDVK